MHRSLHERSKTIIPRSILLTICLESVLGHMLLGAEVTNSVYDVVLWRVHSHNDYLRGQPLFDALECGLNSVEADVFFVG